MQFTFDPPISVKIQKMKARVQWQNQLCLERGIDQTRFILADGHEPDSDAEFSFLVAGDSGWGPHLAHHPQNHMAENMAQQRQQCRFLIHTGDVIYLVGSSEQYQQNFIQPYRDFLMGGERPHRIAFDRMVFRFPFLPVLGNHDYYDLPFILGLLVQMSAPLRRLLGLDLNLNLGWHGSGQGNAYARAFLDYLKPLKARAKLSDHLEQHYSGKTSTGRCLRYIPGYFTRLPNRYYTFRYGGVDFFALDSNTLNTPPPLSGDGEGQVSRRRLEQRYRDLQRRELRLFEAISRLRLSSRKQVERVDDLLTRLEQIEESKFDIDQQLVAHQQGVVDFEQLNWLRQGLIDSWRNADVRGRILYFHHPPYVTETMACRQAQTLAVRRNLRWVLDEVAASIGPPTSDRPLVDLVLNGHAHCFEYLQTGKTGHGDAYMNWIVCGGSGSTLRRQRAEGPEITESLKVKGETQKRVVAHSKLYVGRSGRTLKVRRPYSFLRIDVQAGTPPKLVIRPFIAEWYQQEWHDRALEPFTI